MTLLTVNKIIFDLDGTLINTAPDLTAAMNHVLVQIGRAKVAEEHVRNMVGLGARKMLETGLMHTGGMDGHDLVQLHQAFLVYYADNLANKSVLYDGCLDMLEDLKNANMQLAICTNKPIALALPLVKEFGLTGYFHTIKGGDSFKYNKPDGRHILSTAMELMGNGNIVMIGDSISDISAAKNAKVPSIGVSFGYSDPPVAELGPDYMVDTLNEIPPLMGL